MTIERKHGFCTLCRSRCGQIAVVDDGRLVAVEPDPTHPTGAALCIKGRAAPELVESSNRLLHPLRRTAPKGAADPGWQRITWDDALDETAQRLRAVSTALGPQGVAFAMASPSATPISDGLAWIDRLINRFGTPNVCNATELCNWHKDHAHRYTIGRGIGSPDWARTDCMVLWGHNPSATWLEHASGLVAARARGAALIVVDPRRVGAAMGADLWLPVRPGTDAALALSIGHALLQRQGHDAAFTARWSNAALLVRGDTNCLLRGSDLDRALPPAWRIALDSRGVPLAYDPERAAFVDGREPDVFGARELRLADGSIVTCRSVFTQYRNRCAEYAPKRAAAMTGVAETDIERAAAILHERGPVSYYGWTGIGQHGNATQTDRAIAILMALTGSLDRPGGNVSFGAPAVNLVNGTEFVQPGRPPQIGAAERPLGPAHFGGGVTAADLYHAILTGAPQQVRALVSFGANPLVTRADAKGGQAALAALDFHVHAGPFMHPSAAFADIILPVNLPWEREGLRVGFEVNEAAASLVQLRPAALASAGESRSDMEIVFALAVRLGYGADFWHGDMEAALDHHLAPTGLTMASLRSHPQGISLPVPQKRLRHEERAGDGWRGFDTPSRLVEIWSEALAAGGHDPLPHHRAAVADERLPLILTMAKVVHYCHAQQRDIASLRRRLPDPLLEMAAADAGARGIANGDWVDVTSGTGQVRLKARIAPHMTAGVVCAHYGWAGNNANDLVDFRDADPISGSVNHRGLACEVSRAG